jgi:cytidylate kinase
MLTGSPIFTEGLDMDHEFAPKRVAETLQHLYRHWEQKRKAAASRSDEALPSARALTIALSRETGTEATAIGREIGQRLGWPVYDHELVERIAQDMGTHTRLLESVDEKRVSWLLEAFAALTSVPYASQSAYVHRLVKTVLALGSYGECVIVGRGAAFILPAETTLRVRLIAPLEDRIRTITNQRGVSKEEALRQIEQTDREHNTFVHDHFSKDPTDSRNYDVLLNAARFGIAGCAALVVTALHSLKTRTSRVSQETVTSR